MTREEQRDMACTNWICSQENGKVIKAREVWRAAVEWADQHPQWIPVEEKPYPPKKNKWDKKSEEMLIYGLWMGRPTRLFGTYHYDTNEWSANGLISNITHWMEIIPPTRKED